MVPRHPISPLRQSCLIEGGQFRLLDNTSGVTHEDEVVFWTRRARDDRSSSIGVTL